MPYELIDHTGDIGIRVTAPDVEGLFTEAARAMFDIIADGSAVRPQRRERIVVQGNGQAELLRAWLGELLYRFSADALIFSAFKVLSLDGKELVAEAAGETFDPERHPLRTELKAVTYHQLTLVQRRKGWEAQVIFDV